MSERMTFLCMHVCLCVAFLWKTCVHVYMCLNACGHVCAYLSVCVRACVRCVRCVTTAGPFVVM